MALVVASVPQARRGECADESLFMLAILTGPVMLAAGLLRFGSMVRFVPNAVMVGFINAMAVLIILGQLDDFTGYSTSGPNRIFRTIQRGRLLAGDAVCDPAIGPGLGCCRSGQTSWAAAGCPVSSWTAAASLLVLTIGGTLDIHHHRPFVRLAATSWQPS